MMDNNIEEKLSQYIDQLNEEKKPAEHSETIDSEEYEELLETVKLVRSLKEPEYPGEDYPKRLTASLKSNMAHNKANSSKVKWFVRVIAAAALVAIVFIINGILPNNQTNIVRAMEKAYNEMTAYHGTMEIITMNELKTETLQAKREVWADKDGHYYVKELEGPNKGLITVNNGNKKWQLDQQREQVYQSSVFPDSYRFTFELGNEIEDIKNALDIKIIGEDIIAGRTASKLEITPDGGSAYYLWTDKETNLPLQKETAMQNALQYQITYTNLDFIDTIPSEKLTYVIPPEYKIVDISQEQIVNNLEEAKYLVGFTPVLFTQIPAGFSFDTISVSNGKAKVNYYYTSGKNTIIVSQEKTSRELTPDSSAILGTVNNYPAEILSSIDPGDGTLNGAGAYAVLTDISSIRWQENGFEYTVLGDLSFAEVTEFTKAVAGGEVIIPKANADETGKPQIEVPFDMNIEENEQKSVDAGHSPWKLDPVFVTQVYVSLLISPEGIQGDYPIPYEDITITVNTGTDAIAEIHNEKSPASRVYLKRLIRQDSTGIWTVVGYDPAD